MLSDAEENTEVEITDDTITVLGKELLITSEDVNTGDVIDGILVGSEVVNHSDCRNIVVELRRESMHRECNKSGYRNLKIL